MLLTDEEVYALAMSTGAQPIGSEFVRQIESAVLAKLREQKPVAYLFEEDGNKYWYPSEAKQILGKAVFEHPAPIPEGWLDLLAIIHRDGGHYIAEHGIDKAINYAKDKVWAILSAARSE